ncbi:contractile injection system protein, VgrG/Pvc8 family [Bosea sp. TWI1241]|uniref:phage late control D family protein n=1 Tax=Bosea sp. TWI1241 TaxID=3148904 RepID=UPI0032082A05
MVEIMVPRAAPLDLGKPVARLFYNGIPLWDAISSQVISLTFTDNIEGQADEIQLDVHNKTGEWFERWRPEHGDIVEGSFGYLGSILVPIGTFYVDKPCAKGGRGGDTFSTSGQSAPVTKAARTEKTKSFEKQKLGDVVKKVAKDLGMEVEGEAPDVYFDNLRQRRETDLAFLKRLARDYGAYFVVKGKKIIFIDRKKVDEREPVRTLVKGAREIISYTLNYEAAKTYSKAKVSYYDGNTKKTIEAEVEDKSVKTGDTLKIDDKVENKAQAEALARSRLDEANKKQWTASFTVVGDPLLLAGQPIMLAGYGAWDRKYMIRKARHQLTRNGLTTAIEIAGLRT